MRVALIQLSISAADLAVGILINKEGDLNMKQKVFVKALALLTAFTLTLGCGASALAETDAASFVTAATIPASLTQLMTAANVPVESVAISGRTTLKAGESDYPTLTVLPTTATNKTVTWSSSVTSVATVNSNGVVYARSAGQTLISATSTDGTNLFGYYLLTVTPAYDDDTRVTKVAVYGEANMKIGETCALTYEVWPSTATNKTVSFSSSNTSVATVSDKGVVTAVGAGTATIVVASNDNSSIVDSYEVTVAALVPVTTINVSGKSSMAVGDTYAFTAEVLPSDASNKNVTWSSSNTNVATVDQKGNVTIVASGTVVITATSASDTNVYGSFLIGIENVPVTGIVLTGKTGMVYKATQTVGAKVYPANASIQKLTWTSSNPSVATVDQNGKVTASKKTAGTTIITATATDGSGVKATISISVSKTVISVKSVTVTGRTLIGVGESTQATATVLPANAHNQTLYWDTDNPAVATVDHETGVVTGVSAGTAMINAIATDGTLVRGGYTVTVQGNFVKVTQVNASGNTDLYPGAVSYSSYEIYPVDASDKTVSWSSSNEKVATVSEYGVVTAKAVGTAVITATAKDGSAKAGSYTVTVADNQVMVTKVNVTGKPSMGIGEVQYMGYEIWPANATDKTVSWTSSNDAIATVNQYGVVTGKSVGQATITATAKDGSKQSAKFIVMVGSAKTLVNRIAIYGKTSLNIGAVDYISYEVWPVNADNKSITYSSSNPKVATVNNYGVVKAIAAGTTRITATAQDGSGVTTAYDVTVSNTSAVPVTKVGVSGKESLMVGEVEYLSYEIWPTDATNKEVTYASSNTKVATVNQYGMVTAKSAGTVVITATAKDGSGKQASLTINVSPVSGQVTKINVYGKGSLGIGSVEYLSYEVWPADAADKSITYSTSNKKVATVSEYGVVTGIGAGTATITATAKDGSGVKGTYTVTVSKNTQEVTRLEVYGKGTLAVGEVEYLSYAAWPVDAADKSITYSSSNTNVATVSAYGVVTAKNAGTAVITATAKDGSGTKGTYTVTVGKVPVTYVGVSGKASMTVGQVTYPSYEILPTNATVKTVTYTSSNPAVVHVTTSGIVTAVSAGTATITATATDGSGVSASYTVTVSAK